MILDFSKTQSKIQNLKSIWLGVKITNAFSLAIANYRYYLGASEDVRQVTTGALPGYSAT